MASIRRSPYWPVLAHPILRRLFPGMALSYLGDGISTVAVVLLAQELTTNAAWVGLAVVASTLPGAVGTFTLSRWLSRYSGATLAKWDATLRFFALGLIPLVYALGFLNVGIYIFLLATSSLLHSWGSAGRYTLLADVLPQKDHLTGNAVLSMLSDLGTIAGPPVAAVLLLFWNPAGVLAVDAATFGVLAFSYRFVVASQKAATKPAVDASRTAGFSVIWRTPTLLGLITLSTLFFFLFGPVYVALPTLVRQPDGTASLLATYYTAFGIGAVLGGLLTPYLRNLSLWLTTVTGVLIVGITLLPLGLGAPTPVSVLCFALGGVTWAPYLATSMALYQRTAPAGQLSQVLAADSAIALLSAPAGISLGGLLVVHWGAQNILLISATGMILVASIAIVILLIGRRRAAGPPGSTEPLISPQESAASTGD